jgi:hypothetical protein
MRSGFNITFPLQDSLSRADRLKRLDLLAALFDTAFIVPGTNIRFGIDAVIASILMMASAFNAFVLQRFEGGSNPDRRAPPGVLDTR